jgi:hypothetical protein
MLDDALEGGKPRLALFFAARLKVPMSVWAPEKSIVPCAWETPANDSATSAGAIIRSKRESLC